MDLAARRPPTTMLTPRRRPFDLGRLALNWQWPSMLPVYQARFLWLYARPTQTWERKLSKLLSFVAAAALALSFSSGAKAQAAPAAGAAKAGVAHHNHWQPRKHYYGKRMRARWGAGCKMSGSC